jgi:hypothetical protein
VQVASGAAVGATSIALKGLAASQPAAVQGQPLQIGRRLYLAGADVTADGSGNATITLTTPLLAAAAVDDVARLAEAACEMRLAEQQWSEEASAGGLVNVSASFIETVTDFI